MELTYNYKQLINLVKVSVLRGVTPAIWGPPGIGKSQLCRTVADLLSKDIGQPVQFITLDAPLLQPYDYAVAVPDHKTKSIQLYRTGFLPEKGPIVCAIEDLPHAKQYQQVPIMQIVLDRRIGPLRFADDVWFIVTGNRMEDLAGTHEMGSALLNRMNHFYMVADLDVWREWAKQADLDERVINFLYAYPQYLCELPKEGVKAWPTPRTWHLLSKCIKGIEDVEQIRMFATATVGGVTNVFISWLKYLRDINTEKIIKTGEIPVYKDRAQLFAIVGAVSSWIRKVKPSEIPKHIDNIMKFWNSLEGDYKITFLKELIVYKPNGGADYKYIIALSNCPQAAIISKYLQEIMTLA